MASGPTRSPGSRPSRTWRKNRPNQIGTTVCRVLRVDGTRLHVEGLDAVDGTPVLDVKPWVRELGPRGDVAQPAWMDELMRGYWR
jgi:tRNA (adenine37-N6)-methyltransferase